MDTKPRNLGCIHVVGDVGIHTVGLYDRVGWKVGPLVESRLESNSLLPGLVLCEEVSRSNCPCEEGWIMSIADHDIISQRYFFPRSQPLKEPKMVDVGDAALACFETAAGHDLTVIHFHGNGEIVADYLPGFARQLNDVGADVFFAEYRGYGGSSGVPRLAAMLGDIKAIRRAVDAPDNQIVVFGRSIGSIYAIEFAAQYPGIAGLVLESGIADVLERILLRATPEELGTTRAAMQEAFDRLFNHRDKLQQFQGPTLVMHAEHDHLVDKSHATRNAEWAGGPTRQVLFEQGDHNTIFHANKDPYLAELTSFFDEIRPT